MLCSSHCHALATISIFSVLSAVGTQCTASVCVFLQFSGMGFLHSTTNHLKHGVHNAQSAPVDTLPHYVQFHKWRCTVRWEIPTENTSIKWRFFICNDACNSDLVQLDWLTATILARSKDVMSGGSGHSRGQHIDYNRSGVGNTIPRLTVHVSGMHTQVMSGLTVNIYAIVCTRKETHTYCRYVIPKLSVIPRPALSYI